MGDAMSFNSRRRFLGRLGLGAIAAGTLRLFEPGVFAEELSGRISTPRMTEGPYYPDHLPLDTDNDLLILNNAITPAVGEITHLGGRILDRRGSPVRNALIEIWQVDNFGSYIHSHGTNRQTGKHDTNFQGYGRFLTGWSGEYYFRTVKPVAYPGRTPHIHVRVKLNNKEALTTQCFIKGDPRNQRDGVLNDVENDAQRQAVLADFVPVAGSRIGELSARFDVILGFTPKDNSH